ELIATGYRVRVLDSLSSRVHDTAPPEWLSTEAEFRHGDVRDPAAVAAALAGVDLVVHLAAYQDHLPHPPTFPTLNATPTSRIYEVVIRDRPAVRKVVVASSQSVYGEGRYRCAEHGPFSPAPRGEAQLTAGRWEVECPACGVPADWVAAEEGSTCPTNAYGA